MTTTTTKKSYRVTWSIDVEAESPRDAAIAAMRMQGEDTTANVFSVRLYAEDSRARAERFDTLHDSVEIDLGDEPRHLILAELDALRDARIRDEYDAMTEHDDADDGNDADAEVQP